MPPVGKDPRMRHGHRTAAENAHDEVTPGAVTWPEPNPRWHELARDWYLSLAQSAQAIDYQQSDVAVARVLAEDLSKYLQFKTPMGGNALMAFLSGAGSLLATAGDRRRLKMELARPDTAGETAHDGAVASLAAHKRKRA